MTTSSEWQGTRPGRIELKEAGLSQKEACLVVCDEVEIWRSPDGQTFATVTVTTEGGTHREHHAVDSRTFKDWLLSRVAATYGQNRRPATANDNAIREVLASLNGRAYSERVVNEAPLRVAKYDDCIYIDTGWRNWNAFAVSPDTWEITACPPVPIIRSRRTGEMVMPADKADFGLLRMLLKDLPEAEFVLFMSWCLMALWPRGPYPISVFTGEQGSTKSTKARLAQRLCDPINGDLLQPPEDARDLIAAARNGHVLAYDNMSGVKADLADSLCRLATGSELGGRALFTNYDSATFKACRPLLLNGIGTIATRGDLADRSVVIKLSAIEQRLSEGEFWQMAEAALPGALAGLLDALVLGLRQIAKTPTPNLRMADFAKLIVAAEPKLPWRQGAFLEAYAVNRVNLNATLIEADEVAKRLLAFAEKNESWQGLMSALYSELGQDMSPEQRRAVEWPGNVRWFSDKVTRAAPALRAMGVAVTSRHGKQGTTVTIGKVASPASPEPGTAESGHYDGDAKGDAIPRGEAIASPHRSVASPSKPQKSANADASDARFHLSELAADDRAYLDELGGP